MNRNLWYRIAALWRADLFSPKDLVRRAAMLAVIFLAVHLAGLREYTCILNGTSGSVALGRGMCAFLGLAYVFAYLGFVLLVPILLLAAAILVGWKRLSQGESSAVAKGDGSGQTPLPRNRDLVAAAQQSAAGKGLRKHA